MTDLLPCPFCGSDDLGFQESGDGINEVFSYAVICHGPSCLTSEWGVMCPLPLEDAISAWNTRSEGK